VQAAPPVRAEAEDRQGCRAPKAVRAHAPPARPPTVARPCLCCCWRSSALPAARDCGGAPSRIVRSGLLTGTKALRIEVVRRRLG